MLTQRTKRKKNKKSYKNNNKYKNNDDNHKNTKESKRRKKLKERNSFTDLNNPEKTTEYPKDVGAFFHGITTDVAQMFTSGASVVKSSINAITQPIIGYKNEEVMPYSADVEFFEDDEDDSEVEVPLHNKENNNSSNDNIHEKYKKKSEKLESPLKHQRKYSKGNKNNSLGVKRNSLTSPLKSSHDEYDEYDENDENQKIGFVRRPTPIKIKKKRRLDDKNKKETKQNKKTTPKKRKNNNENKKTEKKSSFLVNIGSEVDMKKIQKLREKSENPKSSTIRVFACLENKTLLLGKSRLVCITPSPTIINPYRGHVSWSALLINIETWQIKYVQREVGHYGKDNQKQVFDRQKSGVGDMCLEVRMKHSSEVKQFFLEDSSDCIVLLGAIQQYTGNDLKPPPISLTLPVPSNTTSTSKDENKNKKQDLFNNNTKIEEPKLETERGIKRKDVNKDDISPAKKRKSLDKNGEIIVQDILPVKLTLDLGPKYAQYARMAKAGIPLGGIRNKMLMNELSSSEIDEVIQKIETYLDEKKKENIKNEGNEKKEKSNESKENDNKEFEKYHSMLKKFIPLPAVEQKMMMDGLTKEKIEEFKNIVQPKTTASSSTLTRSQSLNTQHQQVKRKVGRRTSGTGVALLSLHWTPLPKEKLNQNSIFSKKRASIKSLENPEEIAKLEALFGKTPTPNKYKQSLLKRSLTLPESHLINQSGLDSNSAAMIDSDMKIDSNIPFQNIKSPKKKKKVNLLNLSRSNNVSIVLRSFRKLSYDDICNSIQSFNSETLTSEKILSLQEILPSDKEKRVISEYKGSYDDLAPAEQFFWKITKIPRVYEKINNLYFMVTFESRITHVLESYELIIKACGDVCNSERLAELFSSVLAIGNSMNEGTWKGEAEGFTIDSLLKLTQTKSKSGGITLLDFLIQYHVNKGCRETLQFLEDIPTLREASKLPLNELNMEKNKIKNDFDQIRNEHNLIENDLTNSNHSENNQEGFEVLQSFLNEHEHKINGLQEGNSRLHGACNELREYFAEDGLSMARIIEILIILSKFQDLIDRSLRSQKL